MDQEAVQPTNGVPQTEAEADQEIAERVEDQLVTVQKIVREAIAKQVQAKQQADAANQHGAYCYREGFIDGLAYAIAIIDDQLMDLWGM